MVGTTIAHYEILEKLGEGGMGVVYKAQDTKLDRLVALKFLPARLNASDQDKARFTQEAKAAAALNHPNVCSIMDIQEHDGQMFIVMEYVDGKTLRDREGSVSFKQAVDIGIQIADGLAAAHEKGIVHRDIKPENIMLRKDGLAQIMDFGLAKLRSASSKVNRLTMEGSTVGTAGYMSPEQVLGQDVDHRADIFSLGVVLYELFAGAMPFKGVHETALMYEIVNVDPPPMSSVRPEIDPAVDAIVMECLAKEPGERFQSVAEVAKELRRFKRESGRSRISRVTAVRPVGAAPAVAAPASAGTEGAPARRSRAGWILPVVAALFCATTLALGYLYWKRAPEPARPVRFTILPPERGQFGNDYPAVSPDGTMIVSEASDSTGRTMLWVRTLSSLEMRPLNGTDGATYPFWSPDSRSIGFFQNGKLRRIESNGGPALTIADAQQGRGASWGTAGMIVFAPTFNGGIYVVPEAGGTPTAVTTLDTTMNEDSHRWPSILPDGKHFVYLRRSTAEEKSRICLGATDGSVNKELVRVQSSAAYAAPGYLLYVRDFSLMAHPFDASAGAFTGPAFPIVDDIDMDQALTYAIFGVSASGVLVYDHGSGARGNRQLIWFDRTGKELGKAGTPGLIYDFALSPDERTVAMRRIDRMAQNHDIWMIDLARQTESRFTFSSAREDDPTWSRDGSRLAFDANPNGQPNIHVKPASGTGEESVLLAVSQLTTPLDWSPDGSVLLYQTVLDGKKEDIWGLPINAQGPGTPFPVVATAASEYSAKFSPDGKWVAYCSDESGRYEIYVQAFPKPEGKWQVSTAGGGNPMWSRDGAYVYYLAPDRKLMAVAVTAVGGNFQQGTPEALFATTVDFPSSVNRFAVTADGRFLVNSQQEAGTKKPRVVAIDWMSEIVRK